MINAIPFIGWAFSLVGSISMAVPFWYLWTVRGIGLRYFYPLFPSVLPMDWFFMNFEDCVCVFIVVSIIKGVFVPKLISVSNSASTK